MPEVIISKRLPTIKPIIEQLKESGFFLKQESCDDILAQAGELKI